MQTTDTKQRHDESTFVSPDEISKRDEKRRRAARSLQVAQIKTQDARDRLAQATRVPVPEPAKPKPYKPPQPKAFKAPPAPRPIESIMKRVEDRALPKIFKAHWETFASFQARMAD